MSWRDTLVWLVIGMPVVCVLLVAVDRAGAPSERHAFRPAIRPRAARRHHLRRPHAVAGAATTVAARPADPTGSRPSPRLVPVLEAWPRPPRPVQHPWAPGDNLYRPLVTGAPPGPATVRKRAWSAYATIASPSVYGKGNVERLERGRAPMRYNPLLGGIELMEIHVDAAGRAQLAWPDSTTPLDPFATTA